MTLDIPVWLIPVGALAVGFVVGICWGVAVTAVVVKWRARRRRVPAVDAAIELLGPAQDQDESDGSLLGPAPLRSRRRST